MSSRLSYRPDVDGLRAIAILSVLGFHAFGSVISGGFIGVDVFFVISGFLISSIIYSALERGSFSFVDFYSRRIRRIFPSLAVVLLVVMVVGWYALLPDEFEQLAAYVATGAAFLGNVALYRDAGYFDRAAEIKPLLHLWSLGVEEQFYLFWPLLLWLAWRVRSKVPLVIAATGLASLAANLMLIRSHEAATFYLPFTRLWELLAGGLVAYQQQASAQAPLPAPERQAFAGTRVGPWIADIESTAGLGIVMACLLGLDRTMLYPGWWALLPVGGTCLMIAGGAKAWVNRVLLASPPMVFIGVISYPLYLWHWPLLAFERIIDPERLTAVVRVILLLFAVLLAWATYRLVEAPIRFHVRRGAMALALVAVISAIGVVGYRGAVGSLEPRSAHFGLAKLVAAADATVFAAGNRHPVDGQFVLLSRLGSSPESVLVIGDSFAEHYQARAQALLEDSPTNSRSVVYATSGGCPPVPGVIEAHHGICAELMSQAMAFGRRSEVRAVVIGAHWTGYFAAGHRDPRYSYLIRLPSGKTVPLDQEAGTDEAMSRLSALISHFVDGGKPVYVVLESPDDARFDPRHLVHRSWTQMDFRVEAPLVPRSETEVDREPITSRLRGLIEATGATPVDPLDTLCSNVCAAFAPDGVPIYRDGAHLNPAYVRHQVTYLDSALLMRGAAMD